MRRPTFRAAPTAIAARLCLADAVSDLGSTRRIDALAILLSPLTSVTPPSGCRCGLQPGLDCAPEHTEVKELMQTLVDHGRPDLRQEVERAGNMTVNMCFQEGYPYLASMSLTRDDLDAVITNVGMEEAEAVFVLVADEGGKAGCVYGDMVRLACAFGEWAKKGGAKRYEDLEESGLDEGTLDKGVLAVVDDGGNAPTYPTWWSVHKVRMPHHQEPRAAISLSLATAPLAGALQGGQWHPGDVSSGNRGRHGCHSGEADLPRLRGRAPHV